MLLNGEDKTFTVTHFIVIALYGEASIVGKTLLSRLNQTFCHIVSFIVYNTLETRFQGNEGDFSKSPTPQGWRFCCHCQQRNNGNISVSVDSSKWFPFYEYMTWYYANYE